MLVLDDLNSSAVMATGLEPLIQDVYHLIITERGTMPTDPEFGFGLADIILNSYGPDELPAIADQIETSLSEDDRIASATVSIEIVDNVVTMVVDVAANTEPPTGFRLVGPLSELRAEVVSDTERLLDA
jgi:hypothetical protein